MKESMLAKLYNELTDVLGSEIKMILGEGNVDAKLVLVGEAPGKNEIEQGKPFVGQSGKNLNEFLEILEIKREQIYITNVVKIRTSKINDITGRISNRTPNKEEIELFEDFLIKELSIIQPKIIASLGNTALKSLNGDKKGNIGQYHGIPINMNRGALNSVLFPLYHPASILYRRELKETYVKDLCKLKAYIKESTKSN